MSLVVYRRCHVKGKQQSALDLTGAQWQVSHSRTWTSKDEDDDKDLKIGPRGSSRTRTFLEDNNTDNQWYLISVLITESSLGYVKLALRDTIILWT